MAYMNFILNRSIVITSLASLLVYSIPAYAGPIHEAVVQGSLKKVADLLSENPALFKERDANGETPIQLAARNEDQNILKFLKDWETHQNESTNVQLNSLVESITEVPNVVKSTTGSADSSSSSCGTGSAETILPSSVSVLDSMNPDHPLVARASRLFSEEKEIRIMVPHGGGMGHQRVALSIMTRLHKLGFRGKYQLLCENEETKIKINKLISESDKVTKIFPTDRLEIIGVNEFNFASKPIKYGIVAAFDRDFQIEPVHLGVKNLIQLQPTDWPGLRFVHNEQERYPLETHVLWDHNSQSNLTELIQTSLSDGPKRNYLSQLVSAMKEGKIDVQIAYGLKNWCHKSSAGVDGHEYVSKEDSGLRPNEELKLLVGGIQQSKRTRPLFVLVLEPVGVEAFEGIEDRSRGIKLVMDGFQGPGELTQLKPQDIAVANIGSVPQPLFDALLEGTSVPPVVEGANARSIVKATRGSFMPGGRHYILDDPAQEGAKREFPESHKLFMAVKKALCTNVNMNDANEVRSREEAIARFYDACRSHKMDGYFNAWHRHFLERPDAIVTATTYLR